MLVAGLRELSPVLDELGPGALVIGGLMVRLWLHLRPIDLPARPTPDIDLGINRKTLRISGTKRVVDPLLREHGFTPGYGGEPFRYSKDLEDLGPVIVDVVIAPGASRKDPPLLESGLETVGAPGLAYAELRGPVLTEVTFADGDDVAEFALHLPHLDAALVLKAALAKSGVRTRPDRRQSDAVDAIMLGSACAGHEPSLAALREHRGRSDVRKALGWIEDAFRSPTAGGARQMESHVQDTGGGSGGGAWAHRTATALVKALG